ncbi:MAG: cysteine methyltransferase [Piscirickettsiaceae bacterium]|nr:MAG: cysteine methyltransferase [Piscirickettsiaceae bacterium]PCI70564.1 MAG: cysteine methyltransferase [Piscirickettsiaceae bacterium]
MKVNPNYQKIWAIVSSIPKGGVLTYGQVATKSGLPRRARLVGVALRLAPSSMNLPWHRVVNAQGKISFPPDSEKYKCQQQRLQEEGVVFMSGAINLDCYGWHENMDKDLWQM